LLFAESGTAVARQSQQGTAAPFGYIDQPNAGATVTGAAFPVRAWGLNREDTALRIDLVVDGQVISSAPVRTPRPDVCANPVAAGILHCITSLPGIQFVWNTFAVTDGPHDVDIWITNAKGVTASLGKRSVIVKNGRPGNTPPFGFVDEPNTGAIVKGPAVPVRGWVLDKEDSSLRIDFLVDGQIVSSSPARSDRPDVCAHPIAAGITHCTASQPGVVFTWNTLGLSNGLHEIEMRATDSQSLSSVGMTRIVNVLNDPVSSATPTVYYVAQTPGASDSNDGKSINSPFRTIQRCAIVADAGDICYIRGGTYRETITPVHSGTATARITFAAYGGESVTVSGADLLSDWTLHAGSIFRTASMNWDLGEGNNQIFVDGQMMTEARWPNTGRDLSNPTWAIADGGSGTGHDFGSPVDPDERWTITDSALTQPAGFWDGARINHLSNSGWIAQSGVVTSYLPGKLVFRLLGNRYGVGANTKYYLTGKLEALDTAREWFFDSGLSYLYLWTPAGDDPSIHQVEAKRRLYAFDLSGLSYVTLERINIFASTIKTDMTSSNLIIDGINATYVSHFGVVQGVGSGWWAGWDTGILLHGTNNTLQNCTIAYSAGNGVDVLGLNHTVTNCLIHDVDYMAVDGSAIYTHSRGDDRVGLSGFANAGHRITYNTLYNSGRSLIFFEKTQSARILYNHLYNANLQAQDSGFMYTWGTDGQGTEIAYNVVHDNLISRSGDAAQFYVGFGPGIYFDGNSSNYLVHHNVVWNTPSFGVYVSNGVNIGIFNNTFWNTGADIGGQGSGIDRRNNLWDSGAQFVDAVNGNFLLRPGSPAIDQGSAVTGITDGYVGSAPDAGAYEFGGAVWTAGVNLTNLNVLELDAHAAN
jgi:hypothetical protein